jgi:hypothetical protein
VVQVVTLITATCDQPIGFGLCERWMRRQTHSLAAEQWIVVDDGLEPIVPSMGQQYLRREREPGCTGAASLCRNLLAALAVAEGDPIVIWEHDDYYAPRHLEQLLHQLAKPGVLAAGDDYQRYYHVGERRWKIFHNRGAALCQTAIRRELLPLFRATIEQCLVDDAYGVDSRFWAQLAPAVRSLVRSGTCVGIKGLPGRHGLGLGHRPEVIRRWSFDPQWHVLRQWVGRDAEVYAALPRQAATAVPDHAAAPPPPPALADARAPRLVAPYFGEDPVWQRLARVLGYSARLHCPTWRIEVEAIAPPPLAHPGRTLAFDTNTQKLDHWCDIVERARDGEHLALFDVDTMVLRPLDAVWNLAFDLAYTVRPRDSRLPLNAGVIFLRVSDRLRTFMRAWRDENRVMQADRKRHDLWRRKYGGINQAALGAILEGGAGAGLELRQLPCREWNCEDSTWPLYEPTITRVVHVKSGLRRALFLSAQVAGYPQLTPLIRAWRELERAAAAAPGAVTVAAAPRRPRGRPRTTEPDAIVTSVSIPRPVYDAYCRHALARRESVRSVIQRAIATRAPAQ